MSQKDFAYCVFYFAKIRQNFIWTNDKVKTKHRTRTMTPEEQTLVREQCKEVGVELKNF